MKAWISLWEIHRPLQLLASSLTRHTSLSNSSWPTSRHLSHNTDFSTSVSTIYPALSAPFTLSQALHPKHEANSYPQESPGSDMKKAQILCLLQVYPTGITAGKAGGNLLCKRLQGSQRITKMFLNPWHPM